MTWAQVVLGAGRGRWDRVDIAYQVRTSEGGGMTVAIETNEPLAWPRLGSPPPAAVKPPRLNFAHVCLRCEGRHCEAPECIRWYARSRWMVCPDCDGTGCGNGIDPCGCLFGVVEAWLPAASRGGAGVLSD